MIDLFPISAVCVVFVWCVRDRKRERSNVYTSSNDAPLACSLFLQIKISLFFPFEICARFLSRCLGVSETRAQHRTIQFAKQRH